MQPVLALNMWFPIQFNEAIIKFLRFAKTVAISRIAPCHQSPELCVSAFPFVLFSLGSIEYSDWIEMI